MVQILLVVASLLLAITGALKFVDATGQSSYFKLSDSVLAFFTHRQMLFLAGGLEIGLASYIYFTIDLKKRGLALVWFSALIVVYKVGLRVTHFMGPCSCLGILGSVFKLSNRNVEFITWLLLAAFAITGVLACYHSATTSTSATPNGGQRKSNRIE